MIIKQFISMFIGANVYIAVDENTKKAFQESLNRLNTDYLDLYLIHWPLPEPGYKDWEALIAET